MGEGGERGLEADFDEGHRRRRRRRRSMMNRWMDGRLNVNFDLLPQFGDGPDVR